MNFPLSPPVQSHFLFSQVVIQDGYDSDAGVGHNVATTLKDARKLMTLIYHRLGMMVLPQMVLRKHKAVIILSTSPLLSFPNSKFVNKRQNCQNVANLPMV